MSAPRYLVCPGWVTSKADGQRHYIGPMRLMQLYGVNPRECLTQEESQSWWPPSFYENRRERGRALIALTPRHNGDYTLPTK